jgi:methylated-DNA-protein-cysteine methyltransferase related protein
MNIDPDFRKRVLEIVAQIPRGRVMTYGQLGLVAGFPDRARHVGHVMHSLTEAEAGIIPWQRVINAQGKISTYKIGSGELQRALLESEGVQFNKAGRCDLERLLWWGGGEEGERVKGSKEKK